MLVENIIIIVLSILVGLLASMFMLYVRKHRVKEAVYKEQLANAHSRWMKTRYYIKTQSGKEAFGCILTILSNKAFDNDAIVQILDIDMMGLHEDITLDELKKLFPRYEQYHTEEDKDEN